ncbi:MAG TPA: right-handed parallel beta-helix repeat-containing protein [Pirellulales bacterium]|jgi:hypothetical protein|nr:right-handed parallel beta-helix repeat-containing protein [Pirellulales bacterium]
MKNWLFRSARNQQPKLAARRAVPAPRTRSPRFEILENRQMLTALVVTTASDAAAHSGESLRDAVATANFDAKSGISDTISFASSLNGQTITLAQGQLQLGQGGTGTGTITINGGGSINVSGNKTNSVFQVDQGASATLTNLTIIDGFGAAGGGITNIGTLTVSNSTISGNVCVNNNGGGIYNIGIMTLSNSTVSGNNATALPSNSVATLGGGIYNADILTVSDSTISANTALSGGGGIANSTNGVVTLMDTIVAGNTVQTPSSSNDINGAIQSNSAYNMIGDATGITGISNGVGHNQVGVASPLLGNLANNGGPTQTMALLAGSPAIDTGGPVTTLSAPITSSATSIPVVLAGAIASTADRTVIQIGGEQMLVTGVNLTNNTLTVERGFNGTPAASHASGAGVTLALDQRGLPRGATPDIGAYEYGLLSGPKVSGATTTENVQTTSGLVIVPLAADDPAAYFQITAITGGRLFQNNGVTPIVSGSFITNAQGAAGLKFTPNPGSVDAGGFTVRESTTATVGGLGGPTARATIAVTLTEPKVTGATTTENVQTTSGLAITPGPRDTTAAYFQITSITGGTLYLNNGVTPITSGSFITLAQGAAGLKFTPKANSLAAGGFSIRASTSATASGLSGPTARAAIAVTLSQPRVTAAATTQNKQTTSGLVITPGPHDTSAAFFEITFISGGTLFLNDGTTPVTSGTFITLAQGAAGLKFTPKPGTLVQGGFTIRQSTVANVSGLSGPTARAAIAVSG